MQLPRVQIMDKRIEEYLKEIQCDRVKKSPRKRTLEEIRKFGWKSPYVFKSAKSMYNKEIR